MIKRDEFGACDIEKYVERKIIKVTLLVFVLIVFVGKELYGGVIFIINSVVAYIRFYCRCDLFSVLIDKNHEDIGYILFNYIMALVLTSVFLVVACLNYNGIYTMYGIIGSLLENIIVVVYSIMECLRRISITRRR